MATPRPAPPAHKIVRAAGALVWRPVEGVRIPRDHKDIEVLLVHRPKYDDWSWPKGKQEPGEHIVACATREVEEETGQLIRLGASLTTQRYKLGRHTTKEVHYWIATPDLSDEATLARPLAQRAPQREIDKTRWVKPSKAHRLLTRRGDRRLLDEVLARLDSGILSTRAVVFVRHGKAMKRSTWGERPDGQRPLSRQGVSQVQRLPQLLSAYGVHEVATSPWRRCLTTLAPYASLTGAPLTLVPALSEDRATDNPQEFRSAINDLVGCERYSAAIAVCIHRPTIPAIIGQLALRTPNHLSRHLPQQDPYLHTAQLLVVHLTCGPDPQVVDIEKPRV